MSRYIPCPCDSKLLYHKCCKQYHDGALLPNAEKLMRSRYCAYAMGLVDYIIATTHRDNPNYRAETDAWKDDLVQFSQGTSFRALEIKDFVDGEDKAYVTFRATLQQGEHDVSFTEKSTFVKEDGRWLYRSGEIN